MEHLDFRSCSISAIQGSTFGGVQGLENKKKKLFSASTSQRRLASGEAATWHSPLRAVIGPAKAAEGLDLGLEFEFELRLAFEFELRLELVLFLCLGFGRVGGLGIGFELGLELGIVLRLELDWK